MKKFLFILVAMFIALGVDAQTTVTIRPDSTAGMVEYYPTISNITENTTLVYDMDSIVSIDSMFSAHFEFLGMDTTYLVTDTITTYDTTYLDHYYDLRAVANPGWMFTGWTLVSLTLDSATYDTIIIPDMDTIDGDTVYLNGWLDLDMGLAWIDSTWNETDYTGIEVTANFVQDTTLGIMDVPTDIEYTIYPNPTTGTVSILGDVHWITVLDMNGRVITSTNEPVINLTGYPDGMYLFRITDTAGNMGIRKVIKR